MRVWVAMHQCIGGDKEKLSPQVGCGRCIMLREKAKQRCMHPRPARSEAAPAHTAHTNIDLVLRIILT